MSYEHTHRDIVDACKLGKRQAQFELYQLYSGAMYNICLRMVRKSEVAEDLLQNSFVDVFTKLHTFRFESSIGAWIKRIVVNNCINYLKKRRLEFEALDERVTGISDAAFEPTGENTYKVEIIKRAITELPDGYRVVFTLYLLEGYDHKEISDILGISEATSKSQYSRAKRKLREIVQAYPLESPN